MTARSKRTAIGDFCELLFIIEPLVGRPLGNNEDLAKFLSALRKTLLQAQHIPPERVLAAIRRAAANELHPTKPVSPGAAKAYRNMALDRLETLLKDEKLAKNELLSIASARFGVALGSLNRLSRRDILERLRGYIENERTHDTLARLASSDPAR